MLCGLFVLLLEIFQIKKQLLPYFCAILSMVQRLSFSGNFIESFFKVTRFGNLVIIGFAQYFTSALLIDRQTIYDFRLLLLSTATVFIAAAGYIINDYYDVKIDYINKPDRVVIGKSITRRYAIMFHVVLSILGILIGLFLSWRIAAVNILSVFLLWFYSNNLKRLPLSAILPLPYLRHLPFMLSMFYTERIIQW